MNPPRLLAKSLRERQKPSAPETLRGHTALVVDAARRLLEHRARAALLAAGLPATLEDRLSRIVLLGAFCHDLGKCSNQFQDMVRGKRQAPQLVRHEALSLWLCWPGQPLSDWLRRAVATDADYLVAILAAAGHHRKFWSHAVCTDGAGVSTTLLTGHPDFAPLLALRKDLGAPPVLGDIRVEDSRTCRIADRLASWGESAGAMLGEDDETKRLLALVKAFVLAADVAGSALPRGAEKPAWIDAQLGIADETVARADRAAVVRKRLGSGTLRPFQERVGESRAPITLVRAGCGSGKTLAAYHWAATQHPTRQLWVTYPTTGTATEGFRDYLQPTDVPARLEHGRAEVDVDLFHLRDGSETRRSDERSRAFDRLDAIRSWGCDVITCTVDTVLGLVQNQRRGLYAWPGLCHGAIVFDEIHAYDDTLFGCLLRFLEALPGLPVLLMTASLPQARLLAIEDLCRRVHRVPLAVIDGPRDLEELPRYRIEQASDAWEAVTRCLAEGGKVLWVSNTVDRCIAVAENAPAGYPALVYHSRFRYVDRVRRHAAVIAAFEAPGPVLASATQVAEMSLDLSADLLVTDIAPIPALIQRLGRLNRRGTPDSTKPCIVLPVEGALPYTESQLAEARVWLQRLEGRDVCQRALIDAWSQPPGGAPARLWSEWLDGGARTEPAAVRDASPGVTVLLAEDAARVRAGTARVVEVALPMGPPPRGLKFEKWERFVPIAPEGTIHYDPERGARWLR